MTAAQPKSASQITFLVCRDVVVLVVHAKALYYAGATLS